MLERRASCREIARELGRSPSTVSAEVASHRFITAPKARRGERVDASVDLSAACPRLAAWPRCCNGCGRYRAIGCKRRPHVFYEARAAQLCADSVLVSSRRGIDADEPAAAARLEAIRDCLRRGLSPEQMAACVPSSKNRQIRLSNFDTLMLTASGRAGAVAAGPPAA